MTALRFVSLLFLVCLITLAWVWLGSLRDDGGGTGILVLHDVHVVDVRRGEVLPSQTVVIENGSITAIGTAEAVTPPEGAKAIDVAGGFVVPGLIDTHTHLTWPGQHELEERVIGQALETWVANGVTGVRDVASWGREARQLALRESSERRLLLAPRISVAGMVDRRNLERDPEAGPTQLARSYIDLGMDAIKLRNGLSDDEIRSVIVEAKGAGVPVFGHTWDRQFRTGASAEYSVAAVEAGIDGILHVGGIPQLSGEPPRPPADLDADDWQGWWIHYIADYWAAADPDAEQRLIDLMVERGVWLEPTLITDDWLLDPPFYAAMLGPDYADWLEEVRAGFPRLDGPRVSHYGRAYQSMQAFVLAFVEAGGSVTAGTDCIPRCGFGMQREVELLAGAGLSNAAALRAATLDAAQILGWTDTGAVETGMRADLVVLEANPLEDIRALEAIRSVVLGGRHLGRTELDSILAADAALERRLREERVGGSP